MTKEASPQMWVTTGGPADTRLSSCASQTSAIVDSSVTASVALLRGSAISAANAAGPFGSGRRRNAAQAEATAEAVTAINSVCTKDVIVVVAHDGCNQILRSTNNTEAHANKDADTDTQSKIHASLI